MTRKMMFSLFVASVVAGCASDQQGVLSISPDVFKVVIAAGPDCGLIPAHNLAIRRAAKETLKRGYDEFMVGSIKTTYDGQLVHWLLVRAYKRGQGRRGQTFDARTVLGADWQRAMAETSVNTSCSTEPKGNF